MASISSLTINPIFFKVFKAPGNYLTNGVFLPGSTPNSNIFYHILEIYPET